MSDGPTFDEAVINLTSAAMGSSVYLALHDALDLARRRPVARREARVRVPAVTLTLGRLSPCLNHSDTLRGAA